jgi:hypothetical protein
METIYQFCSQKIEVIVGFDQPGFKWKKRYLNDIFMGIEGVKELRDLPEEVKRSDVIEFFKRENYYHGFLSALIWGGISTRPSKGHKGDKLTSNAYKVLSLPKEVILEIMEKVSFEINNNEYAKAYNLLAVKNKLEGLNVSFFTKILFFISECSDSSSRPTENNLKLLIYDKWTKLIHLLLLLESNELEKVEKYFGKNYLQDFFPKTINALEINLVYCKSRYECESYLDYCKRLNKLAWELSENFQIQIQSGQLESFLFGVSNNIRNNLVSNNRQVIKEKIKYYVSKGEK